MLLIEHRTATYHVVTVKIFNRQWVTACAVSQKKPSFEVDRPDMVGILGLC